MDLDFDGTVTLDTVFPFSSAGQFQTALFPGGHFYLRSLSNELIQRLIANVLA
jgi:surfactin synthase thioesterase subunit